MNSRRLIIAGLLAVLGLFTYFALTTGARAGAQVAIRKMAEESEATQRATLLALEGASNAPARVALPVVAEATETPVEYSVIAAFNAWVLECRGETDPRTRGQLRYLPASLVQRMSEERRADLLLFDVEQVDTDPLRKLSLALMRNWQQLARQTGEDLGDAYLQVLRAEQDPQLWEMWIDLSLLLVWEDDRVFNELLQQAFNWTEGTVGDPNTLITTLVIACDRRNSSEDLAALIQLVDAEWISSINQTAFLTQLASSFTWEQLDPHYHQLILRFDKLGIPWGVIEAIRIRCGEQYGDGPRESDLVSYIPYQLYTCSQRSLRRASYELLGEYGGEAGRQMLLALLGDEQADRPAVLGFMALDGLITVGEILPYMRDEEAAMQEAAVRALGYLVQHDPQAYTELCQLAQSEPDTKLRGLCVKAIADTARADRLDALTQALDDEQQFVQAQAIRGIGMYEEPQLELLLGIATDTARGEGVRSMAYLEASYDTPDEEIGKLFFEMQADGNPAQVQEWGYQGLAGVAAALRHKDQEQLTPWEQEVLQHWQDVRTQVPATLSEKVADGFVPDFLPNGTGALGLALLGDDSMAELADRYADSLIQQFLSPQAAHERAASEMLLGAMDAENPASRGYRREQDVMSRIASFLSN